MNHSRAMFRLALLSRAAPARWAGLVLLWLDRIRERRAIDGLSDHMLKDLGLSRADVEAEASKRFWRA